MCNKNSHILHISPFICSFSFSPMEISVTDFSAPIGASVLKFLCTPLGRQSVLCKMKIKMLILILPSFSFFPSVTLIYYTWTFFLSKISQQSKKEGKDQESIQSITEPDPGYQWESDNVTNTHQKRESRGLPYPSR